MSDATINSVSHIHANHMGPGILFPSLPATHGGIRTNYATCKLCGGEMLFDSCSQVCARPRCRTLLMFVAKQKPEFRQEFWARFDAAPREASAGGLKLWDLEQMMQAAIAESEDELEQVESAA